MGLFCTLAFLLFFLKIERYKYVLGRRMGSFVTGGWRPPAFCFVNERDTSCLTAFASLPSFPLLVSG